MFADSAELATEEVLPARRPERLGRIPVLLIEGSFS